MEGGQIKGLVRESDLFETGTKNKNLVTEVIPAGVTREQGEKTPSGLQKCIQDNSSGQAIGLGLEQYRSRVT